MAKVFDDLATKFVSFSDALEAQFGDLSIDFSLATGNNKALKGGSKWAADAAGDARALSAAAEEREAAKKRGEEILLQLSPGYFDSAFDALKHELCQMGPDARQDDIDVVVDRLTAAMEVVGMRLARHVLKNQDKLIAGITTVTHVEDDVRAAYVVCRGSRGQLRMAADEVQRQLKIITSTRKKQHAMELLDVLSRVKKVKDLPAALRLAHEEGDHAEAILLCVDCFHAVDTLGSFKIAQALQQAVQRAYYDAMQHLHTALMNVCTDFEGESYSRLLEAYLLQSVPPAALAEKVLSCFAELFEDHSTRLVRSMVLARAFAQQTDQPASSHSSSSGGFQLEECSFADLCRRVQPDMLCTCLGKLLEAVFDLLASYHSMLAWHEAGLAEHTQAAAAAAAAAASAAARSPRQSQDGAGTTESPAAASADALPSQEQLEQVQAATKGILAAVQAALQANRVATIETAAVRVKELLAGAGGCAGADFCQVVAYCLRFASLAEAFTGSQLSSRDALMHILGAFVKGSHKSSMQALKHALASERWGAGPSQTAGSAGPSCEHSSMGSDVLRVHHSLTNSCCKVPGLGEDGFCAGFTGWIMAGNPFRQQGRAVGGRSVLDSAGSKATPVPPAAPSASDPNSIRTASVDLRAVSGSCYSVLQWLANYAALMTALPAQQQLLWGGMTELFDNYMLACFVLFSGVSLQTLVWHDDCLPNRLRSALLRITTSSNCKYKAEVEELQRTKPAQAAASAAASGSFLGLGGSTAAGGNGIGGAGALDVLTRKFKHTMVELINTDLSQPIINGPSSHSPMQAASRPPPQQPVQQPQQRSAPAVSSQQQQQQRPEPLQRQQQPQADASTASSEQGAPSGASQVASSDSLQPGAHATFLKQCVSAIDSMGLLADALKAAKPALLQLLRGAGIAKDVEAYFARTVDATLDLKDTIYLGAAKQMLPGLADAEYGLSSAIAQCNYNMQQPATRYQPWVAEVLQEYTAFGKFVAGTKLAADVQVKFWEAALKLGAEAMLDGMGQIRKCSQEGRAAMSLDLSAVEKGLRPLAPPSALSSLRRVDNYIKAFYIPWEELSRWAQTHLAEYGKARILVLVEAMADAYGIKRSQQAALLDSMRTQLTEFV